MDKHYTLTGRFGIYTAGSDRVTVIGQQDGCDVKIVNHTPYEDVLFAKIVPNSDGSGWILVRIPPFYYPILINGIELNRVHFLEDGDNIECPNGSFRFNILPGRQIEPSVTHVHKNGKMLWALVAAVLVIAVIVGYRIFDGQRDNLSDSMKSLIEASLFTIRVDSLQLLKGDSIVDSYSYASCPVGTAFLTKDSLLITARHCLQPWLGSVSPTDFADIPKAVDWPVRSALLAETQNQLSDSVAYRIVSFLTLTDEEGRSMAISSDSFKINYDFDDIVELGSYRSPMYWRSISHRYSRRDMMLGDIAVAEWDRGGEIPMASDDDIRRLLAHSKEKLHFFGHPQAAVTGYAIDYKTDILRVPLSDEQGHIFLLAHEGGLSSGFSGAPVIVRDGAGFKAVGVASVIDESNANRSYSVPLSEVDYVLKN